MADTALSRHVSAGVRALSAPSAPAFLSLYALAVAAVTALYYWQGWTLFVLPAMPIPFLPFFYRRPVYLTAIAILVAATQLVFLDGRLPMEGWVVLAGPALVGTTELVALAVRQRARTLEALRTSEERYRLLVETPNVIPWELSLPSWRFSYVGPQAVASLGYAQEDWYVEGFFESHLHPEDREWAMAFCQAASARGEDHEFTYRMIASDGRIVWLRDLVVVVEGLDGVDSLRGVMVDITAQRAAEEEQRTLEEQMRHTQRLESIGLLAAAIAHDFNNMLSVILGRTELARRETSPGTPAAQRLADIETAAERAGELTRQMLAYSGKGSLELGIHDLSTVVRDTSDLVRAAIPKSGELRLELSADPLRVEVDAGQLTQIVMNLIMNAAEALPEGVGIVSVRTGFIACTPELRAGCVVCDDDLPAHCAVLEVEDTGSGIRPEEIQRIFDPFHTTKRLGHGLGLASLRGIVKTHRGAIHVDSRPAHGTTFRVLFPLADAEKSKPQVHVDESLAEGLEPN